MRFQPAHISLTTRRTDTLTRQPADPHASPFMDKELPDRPAAKARAIRRAYLTIAQSISASTVGDKLQIARERQLL